MMLKCTTRSRNVKKSNIWIFALFIPRSTSMADIPLKNKKSLQAILRKLQTFGLAKVNILPPRRLHRPCCLKILTGN